MTKLYSRSQLLMQNLVYPAILGNVIFLTASKCMPLENVVVHIHDGTLSLSMLLIWIFGMSYLTNFVTLPRNYGALAFAIDILEILVIFGVFYVIGFISQGENNGAIKWWIVYLLLGFVPWIELAWDKVTREPKRVDIKFVLALSGFLFLSACFSEEWVFVLPLVQIIIFGVIVAWWVKLGSDSRFAPPRSFAFIRWLRHRFH